LPVPVQTDVLPSRAIGPSRQGEPADTVDLMDGTPRVLIGYATAAGSTAGIAERIADTLRAQGCEVVCRPVGPDLDLSGFDAVVVGSAVHNMAWLRPAVDVLERFPATGGPPVWCFSVGGLSPSGPVTGRLTDRELRTVEKGFPSSFRCREHRFFGGIVEMRGVPLWGRIFWRLMGGRPGDHRDWPAVERWARHIAAGFPPRPADEGREAARRGTSGTPPPGAGARG
jgi:menaquinone-dependent protoporphyrinogen oxidase